MLICLVLLSMGNTRETLGKHSGEYSCESGRRWETLWGILLRIGKALGNTLGNTLVVGLGLGKHSGEYSCGRVGPLGKVVLDAPGCKSDLGHTI